MTPNRWNLVASYAGAEARSHAVHPMLERSMRHFPSEIADKAERLEIWTLPTSNPALASDEHEAQLFDGTGNRLGRIYVREDYDVDVLDQQFVPSDGLVTDEQQHARVRGQM